LSAAALLVEVMNADGEFNDDERRAFFGSVQTQFSLSKDEATDLLALAEKQVKQATDLYEFTVEVNKYFKPEQKLALIQELWQAAYADEILHRHEEHLVRKVADLLHVPNTSVLAAKRRAQAGAITDNRDLEMESKGSAVSIEGFKCSTQTAFRKWSQCCHARAILVDALVLAPHVGQAS
jgi:uncharacterized tellurite resistance protein B-like protein